MEQKIRDYVSYQFRFDKRDDIDDLKEEIIGNLTDRYYENLSKYNDPEKAYIEAIKQMGDFSNNNASKVPDEFSVKPNFSDIALLVGVILSIFGLIIMFINTLAGAIITSLSILSFSGGAYYLYSYSQYVRKNYMDIEKHNSLLKKIFKNMKTSFVFWSISLSIIFSKIILGIINSLALFFYTQNFDIENPKLLIMDPRTIIALEVIIFLILLLIFLSIFNNIYNRLITKYYYLTGDTNLKGGVAETYEFLSDKEHNSLFSFSKILNSKYFMPIFGLIYFLPSLFFHVEIYQRIDNFSYNHETTYTNLIGLFVHLFNSLETLALGILFILLTIFLTVVLIKGFISDKKNDKLLIISYYGWFVGNFALFAILDIFELANFTYLTSAVIGYLLIGAIVLTIIIIIRRSINKKKQ